MRLSLKPGLTKPVNWLCLEISNVSATVVISAAVEGFVDEAVARKLVVHAGGQVGPIYGKNGKSALQSKIRGYNNAARYSAWAAFVDLDDDAACAPQMRDMWLPDPSPHFCFRIAVREVEAWLMADAQTLARYLAVKQNAIPRDPEKLPRPKDAMVNLARRSRRRSVYSDMTPRDGSGRRTGPAYPSRMVEYVARHWRPDVAAERADSLRQAMRCLDRLVQVFREKADA